MKASAGEVSAVREDRGMQTKYVKIVNHALRAFIRWR